MIDLLVEDMPEGGIGEAVDAQAELVDEVAVGIGFEIIRIGGGDEERHRRTRREDDIGSTVADGAEALFIRIDVDAIVLFEMRLDARFGV